MTFLPIVERELRVRARSKGWHWIRFSVVAVGALVCAPGLLWGDPRRTGGSWEGSFYRVGGGSVSIELRGVFADRGCHQFGTA